MSRSASSSSSSGVEVPGSESEAGTSAPPIPEQEPLPADVDTENIISVESVEVIIPVTVTDSEGRFVSDLTQEDFTIYDNGVEQTITYFNAERNQPVVVGFLVDLSNASRIQWKTFQQSAVDLVFTILNGEEKYSGYLIGFGNQSELMVDTTSDPAPIVERLEQLDPGGGAAFYNAIYQAITDRSLLPGEPYEPRRVIVVVGDGHDNASDWRREQIIEMLQRDLVTIYAVSTESFGFQSDGSKNLRALAAATGGKVEYPLLDVYDNTQGFLSRPRDEGNFEFAVGTGQYSAKLAEAIYGSIRNLVGEITTQYILRYVPNNPSPEAEERKVEVTVDLPAVEVRARQSYFNR